MPYRTRLRRTRALSPGRLTCWVKRLDAPSPKHPVVEGLHRPERAAGAPQARASVGGAIDPLTRREGEVLRLIAAGKRSREIAAALGLSVRTVERHTATIYAKLEVHNRAEATAYAFRSSLI